MNTLDRVRSLMFKAMSIGQEIGFIPVSRAEIQDIKRESINLNPIEESNICGCEIWVTDYAPCIRDRIREIDVPVVRFSEAERIPRAVVSIDADRASDYVNVRLDKYICKNDTELALTVICDPWLRLKQRFPRIQKWFPIRREIVRVNGMVLYPFLNVQFPVNRHFVRFAVR